MKKVWVSRGKKVIIPFSAGFLLRIEICPGCDDDDDNEYPDSPEGWYHLTGSIFVGWVATVVISCVGSR